ncbi:MAG: hypothetical protein A2X49_03950 [Lentisphaerae bacterium GWF2_52_8]|nr:MAG: hypothetical protein A2X49_03950 [Lentisphaerae bacterium GWF2_52_8]
MIRILVKRLTAEGSDFSGEERPSFLELEESPLLFCEAPVKYEFRASIVDAGVLVEGQISTVLKAVCDRCLAPLSSPLSNKLCHYYEKVTEDELDISSELREDLLINIPYRFLCSKDCPGLCQQCGSNLKEGACKCASGKESENGKTGRPPTAKSNNIWDALDGLKG